MELDEPLAAAKWAAVPPGDRPIARHAPLAFELSDAERQALASWRVRPRVVAIEGRSDEILREPEVAE